MVGPLKRGVGVSAPAGYAAFLGLIVWLTFRVAQLSERFLVAGNCVATTLIILFLFIDCQAISLNICMLSVPCSRMHATTIYILGVIVVRRPLRAPWTLLLVRRLMN